MIEVIDVKSSLQLGNGSLEGGVDSPMLGMEIDGHGVEIEGWAVGLDDPVERVEILHGDVVVRTVASKVPRPDIGEAYPGAPGAGISGFRTLVTFVGLPMTPVLRVAAIVGGRRRDIAEITFRRKPLRPVVAPTMHPLIISTMGRTGSVWLSRLLGEHPKVVTYRPFQSEPRAGVYWMHILRSLADAGSMVQALAPLQMKDVWWLGDQDLSKYAQALDPTIQSWLLGENIEELATFCLQSIARFYTQAAEEAGKDTSEVVYYAEKYPTSFVPSLLLELDPRAREIFLVRDPRDQLASLAAWTARGQGNFAQGEANDVEGYMRWLMPHTRQLLMHWRARSSKSHLLRYEDLILQPAKSLANLFSYLGIEDDAATVMGVIQRATERGHELQRAHQTSSNAAASIGRWRSEIDESLWPEMHQLFSEELATWYPEAEVDERRAGTG